MSNSYALAYTEVLEVLKYLPEETEKIPTKIMLFLQKNQDNSYQYNFNVDIPIDEQPMSDIAKAMLSNFYRDYIATPEEKARILQEEKYEIERYEAAQREKYNPDNLFKNSKYGQKTVQQENQLNDNLPIEIEKTNIFSKLINFIKNIFK